MKINRKTAISTLALVGLSLGATVSAAEIARPKISYYNLSAEERTILQEAHELHNLGKDEEARKLINSSGIKMPGFEKEKGRRTDSKYPDRLEKFKELVEQEDFESFQKAVEGTPVEHVINTEEKFDAFVQAHELRVEGKIEEAKQVLEDAGIKPFGFGNKTGWSHK